MQILILKGSEEGSVTYQEFTLREKREVERENEGVEETRRLVVRSRDRIRKPERRQWTSNERTEKLSKNCTQKK